MSSMHALLRRLASASCCGGLKPGPGRREQMPGRPRIGCFLGAKKKREKNFSEPPCVCGATRPASVEAARSARGQPGNGDRTRPPWRPSPPRKSPNKGSRCQRETMSMRCSALDMEYKAAGNPPRANQKSRNPVQPASKQGCLGLPRPIVGLRFLLEHKTNGTHITALTLALRGIAAAQKFVQGPRRRHATGGPGMGADGYNYCPVRRPLGCSRALCIQTFLSTRV